jgi:hypothetical protein
MRRVKRKAAKKRLKATTGKLKATTGKLKATTGQPNADGNSYYSPRPTTRLAARMTTSLVLAKPNHRPAILSSVGGSLIDAVRDAGLYSASTIGPSVVGKLKRTKLDESDGDAEDDRPKKRKPPTTHQAPFWPRKLDEAATTARAQLAVEEQDSDTGQHIDTDQSQLTDDEQPAPVLIPEHLPLGGMPTNPNGEWGLTREDIYLAGVAARKPFKRAKDKYSKYYAKAKKAGFPNGPVPHLSTLLAVAAAPTVAPSQLADWLISQIKESDIIQSAPAARNPVEPVSDTHAIIPRQRKAGNGWDLDEKTKKMFMDAGIGIAMPFCRCECHQHQSSYKDHTVRQCHCMSYEARAKKYWEENPLFSSEGE